MKEVSRTDWSALPVGYFSPSQAWAYISCPACYEAERILHIPKPLSADLMVGRFAHAALAQMRSVLVDGIEFDPDATEFAIEAGAQAFDEVLAEQRFVDEDGEAYPVEIELTKKYTDIGDAKDVAARVTRYALPEIAKYDRAAGVLAYEARVRHLGTSAWAYPALKAKMSPEEAADAEEEAAEQFVDGIKPCFPFPVKAYLDVMYETHVLKDAKTAGRLGSPDHLAALQLLMYGMPWYDAGQPLKLGWDVMIKTKSPQYAAYWVNGSGEATPEQYEYARWRVLAAADAICNGDFPPNDGSLFCKYEHGLPKGERAAMDFPVAV